MKFQLTILLLALVVVPFINGLPAKKPVDKKSLDKKHALVKGHLSKKNADLKPLLKKFIRSHDQTYDEDDDSADGVISIENLYGPIIINVGSSGDEYDYGNPWIYDGGEYEGGDYYTDDDSGVYDTTDDSGVYDTTEYSISED